MTKRHIMENNDRGDASPDESRIGPALRLMMQREPSPRSNSICSSRTISPCKSARESGHSSGA